MMDVINAVFTALSIILGAADAEAAKAAPPPPCAGAACDRHRESPLGPQGWQPGADTPANPAASPNGR